MTDVRCPEHIVTRPSGPKLPTRSPDDLTQNRFGGRRSCKRQRREVEFCSLQNYFTLVRAEVAPIMNQRMSVKSRALFSTLIVAALFCFDAAVAQTSKEAAIFPPPQYQIF